VRHKLTNCSKFGKIHNIFKDKGGKIIETKLVFKVKVAIALINMVDVHVTSWNKANEKHVQGSRTKEEQIYT